MSNESPRWIKEIPNAKQVESKRKLTKDETREAKEFEEAVKSGKITEWFNK